MKVVDSASDALFKLDILGMTGDKQYERELELEDNMRYNQGEPGTMPNAMPVIPNAVFSPTLQRPRPTT